MIKTKLDTYKAYFYQLLYCIFMIGFFFFLFYQMGA